MHKYAILLDNLNNTPQTKFYLETLLLTPKYDITLFVISKQNTVACHYPIFNISDYFNWNGISVITSQNTLEKSIAYPVVGPRIIIGNARYKDYINVGKFDMNFINEIVEEYYKKENTDGISPGIKR